MLRLPGGLPVSLDSREALERRVQGLEYRVEMLERQVRARLKEEAFNRELSLKDTV